MNTRQVIEVICRPVLMDAICEQGEKCFHNIHYLCEWEGPPMSGATRTHQCIPTDACVINAIVNNLDIDVVRRDNGCVRIEGSYDIIVWFTWDAGRRIGQAMDTFDFAVDVPLFPVNGGCREIFCECDNDPRVNNHVAELPTFVCAENLRLEVIEAIAERDGTGANDVCPGCDMRIRVVVEKVFLAFRHGQQIICLPVCPPEECAPEEVGPPAGTCPPFVNPTECPDWCVQDDFFSPTACATCPPPQVTAPPTPTPGP